MPSRLPNGSRLLRRFRPTCSYSVDEPDGGAIHLPSEGLSFCDEKEEEAREDEEGRGGLAFVRAPFCFERFLVLHEQGETDTGVSTDFLTFEEKK